MRPAFEHVEIGDHAGLAQLAMHAHGSDFPGLHEQRMGARKIWEGGLFALNNKRPRFRGWSEPRPFCGTVQQSPTALPFKAKASTSGGSALFNLDQFREKICRSVRKAVLFSIGRYAGLIRP